MRKQVKDKERRDHHQQQEVRPNILESVTGK